MVPVAIQACAIIIFVAGVILIGYLWTNLRSCKWNCRRLRDENASLMDDYSRLEDWADRLERENQLLSISDLPPRHQKMITDFIKAKKIAHQSKGVAR